MNPFLKDYLSYNKRERNGIFILCLIILILLFSDTIFSFFMVEEKIDFKEFETQIDAFVLERNKHQDSVNLARLNYKDKYSNFTKPVKARELFDFDPNNTFEKDWIKLGLSPKQYAIVKNYISKGGKFYKKEDLKKIYGINESLYLTLEPFIKIEHERSNNFNPENTSQKNRSYHIPTKKLVVELNAADSTQLTKLKGVGPVFSSRIIKYRERLGGFANVSQLSEVYGISQELLIEISPHLKTDTSLINKININTCQPVELIRHPYIENWNIANAIVNYRNKHGEYKSVEDIRKLDLVNEELYLKLALYLSK